MSADTRGAGATREARERPARPPLGSPKACLATVTKNHPELGNQAKGGTTCDVLLERFIRGLAEAVGSPSEWGFSAEPCSHLRPGALAGGACAPGMLSPHPHV